jgi:hypothetical protein
LPDAETQALAALCQRRNQLLEMEQMSVSEISCSESYNRDPKIGREKEYGSEQGTGNSK